MVERTSPRERAEGAASAGGSLVRERLAGKRVLITGVTGFLGQVVLERLLLDFPETRIVALVRSQTGSTAQERVDYLLRKPSFTALREGRGQEGLLDLLHERVDVVDGDFSRAVSELPGVLD